MIHKKSKKRNFKKSYQRISKSKKYIGGENCSQYKTESICRSHIPECLWKPMSSKCIDNVNYSKEKSHASETLKPQSTQQQETEKHGLQLEKEVQTLPISTSKTSSIVFEKRQPLASSVVFGKKQPLASAILEKQQSTSVTEPPKVKLLQSLPQKRNPLDNLQLIEPIIAFDKSWPIITDVINVPGDGDCLFHALRAGLRSLGLYQGTTRELRTLIVNELRILLKNGDDLSPIFYSDALDRQSAVDNLTFGAYFESQHAKYISKKNPLSKQVRSYLDRMANREWGTEIEIWMASRLFNVNIDVYTLPRIVDPTDPEKKKLIPAPSGRNGPKGTGNYLPLLCLNLNEDTSKPTIRLFNASGASSVGRHYEVLPSSISIDSYLS
jgi:hypothetical protein